ncbi:MAG TPA: PTS sugar transporter subunit IIA [Candidatus Sumerlaeota bacterium]|nr:PTS sugar transporter subunit IIA [Candidatus Sumerlaeota bacterium]
MEITERVIREADIVDITGMTKEGALQALVDTLAKRPEVTDPKELYESIINREKVISTGIGISLALPHVKIPSVRNFVLAIGRSTRGIDFDALDGHLVHIVAMFCASDKQAGEFLKVLAQLVLRFKDKELRQKILLTPDPEKVREVLLSYE